MTGASPGVDAGSRTGATHRRVRLLAAGAAAVVLVALVVVGERWRTHPERFEPAGGSITQVALPVGGSTVIGMLAAPLEGEVRLIDAEPVVVGDTAVAEVRVLICHRKPGRDSLAAVRGTADQVCARTSTARDTPLGAWSQANAYLAVELTARQPGAVRVEGVRVRYRSGVQVGEQVTGMTALLSVGATG